jgi:hypothetical protein
MSRVPWCACNCSALTRPTPMCPFVCVPPPPSPFLPPCLLPPPLVQRAPCVRRRWTLTASSWWRTPVPSCGTLRRPRKRSLTRPRRVAQAPPPPPRPPPLPHPAPTCSTMVPPRFASVRAVGPPPPCHRPSSSCDPSPNPHPGKWYHPPPTHPLSLVPVCRGERVHCQGPWLRATST